MSASRYSELRRRAAGRRTAVAPFSVSIEERASDGTLTLAGHAAVFNRTSADLGGFRESISPGAFSQVLARDRGDIMLLVGHDPGQILSRTGSGLELREDAQGLAVRCELPPTSLARDIHTLVRAGILRQMSFQFTCGADSWDERDGMPHRTVTRVANLFETSIVAAPAYAETDIGARALERQPAEVRSAAQRQLRLLKDKTMKTTDKAAKSF